MFVFNLDTVADSVVLSGNEEKIKLCTSRYGVVSCLNASVLKDDWGILLPKIVKIRTHLLKMGHFDVF